MVADKPSMPTELTNAHNCQYLGQAGLTQVATPADVPKNCVKVQVGPGFSTQSAHFKAGNRDRLCQAEG